MKTYKFFKVKDTLIILTAIFFISSILFTSCKKEDEEESGEPYFSIEGSPTGLSVSTAGLTKSYVVRSNRPWQIVAQDEADWVKVFPEEGDDDGIFKFIIDQNTTFDQRTINYAFVVDGEEQPILFRIDQEANVPFIIITEGETGVGVAAAGGEFVVNVEANVNWTYSVEGADWISEQSVTDNLITLIATKNIGKKRTAIITLTSPDFPNLSEEVTITQSAGSVILEEDFSWLAYGSAIPYVTTGETRYDSWTQEEQNMGWDSTPNEFSSNQQVVYARQGFIKLGKTSYGGDMISPKLEDIEGSVTVKVTFKAATYISAGGTIDDNILKVFAVNAGTASVDQFEIDNIPNSQAQDEEGIVNDIWDPARAYSFTIDGATSETRVRFLGGDFYLKGVGKGKNRIFLDDIKVEIID